MSYKWESASTPQGRERLKELLDQGHRIVGKVGEFGRITALWKSDGGAYDIDGYISESMFHKARLDDIEFLDPDPQPKAKDKSHSELGYGDYVCIEQFRYGVPNEFWEYKVIGTLRSNCWVDVPVKHSPAEVRHESMEDVICCICCGIDETKVVRFKLSEVVPHRRYWELNRRQGKEGGV